MQTGTVNCGKNGRMKAQTKFQLSGPSPVTIFAKNLASTNPAG
jgi:hypothetical protein